MKETDIISLMTKCAERSVHQMNACFETDAEIIRWGSQLLAVSIDDFSSEDILSGCHPAVLGWNIAAATMSDILAVGAEPKFFLQSVVVDKHTEKAFLKAFSSGIQKALRTYGSFLLGGDVGKGREWRFTGVAIGSLARKAELMTRRIREKEGIIVVTGGLGDANLDAFLGNSRFFCECRLKESRMLRGEKAACIDTSDGFMSALESMRNLNPGHCMTIDMDSIPYAKGVLSAAERRGIPPEAFLLGGAGEYELLFFLPSSAQKEIRRFSELKQIGRFLKKKKGGITLDKNGKRFSFKNASLFIDPRDQNSLDSYKKRVIKRARELYLPGGENAV